MVLPTVEIWEWINNSIQHITWHVVTCPCWDYSHFHFFQRLIMENLKLSFISEHALRGLPKLRSIHLIFCGLQKLPELYHVKATLNTFRIVDDILSSIPNDAMMEFDQLRYVSFFNNFLEFIPIICNTLIELRMDHNEIEQIVNISVDPGSRLEVLNLRDNRISYISFTFLQNLPLLQTLALQNNQLLTLPNPDTFVHQTTVPLGLLVGGNPWVCNASMVWLLNATLKDDHFIFTYFYIYAFGGMVCHGPPKMNGTLLGQIGQRGKVMSLKGGYRHFHESFVTSCNGSGQNNNFLNHWSSKFHKNVISLLVFYDTKSQCALLIFS